MKIEIYIPENDEIEKLLNMEEDDFNVWCGTEYKKYWTLLSNIMLIYKKSKFKSDKSKEIESYLSTKKFIGFVDGSCVKDPNDKNFGSVSYGGILFINNNSEAATTFKGLVEEKKYKDLENVGGELKGCLVAIDLAIKNEWPEIVICHDYLGISEYANHKWHSDKPGINKYVNKIKEFRKKINIEFCKVPAHAGIEFNDIADELAKSALNMMSNKTNNKFVIEKNKILTKENSDYFKNIYKVIFKSLILIEMITLNSNLNDLTVQELFLTCRVKKITLNDMIEKQTHIMEECDLDPLDVSYNDILLE